MMALLQKDVLYILMLVCFVAVGAHITIKWRHENKFAEKHGCQAPYSLVKTKEPFIGLDFILSGIQASRNARYLDFIRERFQKHGTTFVTRRIVYETINTIDPENLKHILSTGFHDFRMSTPRVNAMRPLFGEGIFTTDGLEWAHSRALLRPAFTRSNMAPLLKMMERHFQLLLRHIPSDGPTTFDLKDLLYSFTMDTATEFLLGRSTHTLDPRNPNEKASDFARDYVACSMETVRRMRTAPLDFLCINWEVDRARKRVCAYVDDFVDEALELRKSGKLDTHNADRKDEEDNDDEYCVKYSFLREVARDTDNRQVLRDQILNVMLASGDTTAGLLCNLFFMLAQRPEVYAKLRDEVLSCVGNDLPTEDQLKNMTYLRWCINESLRLHPVVPGNTRQAAVDTWLPRGGGPDGTQPIFVRKDTCVVFYVYSMHRREDIFGPNTEEFRPERWDGLRPGWGFLPFNGGLRICLGQQFALAETTYVVARMVQSFSAMESRDERPWTERHTLILSPRNGVLCAVTPSSRT